MSISLKMLTAEADAGHRFFRFDRTYPWFRNLKRGGLVKETVVTFRVENVPVNLTPKGEEQMREWCEKNCAGPWRVQSGKLYLESEDDVVLVQMTFS